MSRKYKYFVSKEIWCIVDTNNNVAMLVDHAFSTRKKCISLFLLKYKESWKYWYRRGCRAAKIRIHGEF